MQERFHRSQARIRVYRGGNRAGKTTAGAVEVGWWATGQHPYLKTHDKPRILCVANDWSMVGSPMWEKLSEPGGVKVAGKGSRTPPILPKRMISELAWEDRANNVPNLCVLSNGTRITFRSCASGRSKFQGTEFDLVWIDEELEAYDIYEEIRRAMIDRGGKMIWTATPLARARPLIALHEAASEAGGVISVEEFVASMLDNPHVDEAAKLEFVAELMREHPDYYETRVSGEFLIMEGLVYATYRPQIHEISRDRFNELDPTHCYPRILGIDPGTADPFVVGWAMLLPGDKRRVVFYREFYQTHTSLDDVCARVAHESVGEPIVLAVVDPSANRHDARGYDSVYSELARKLTQAGLRSAVTGGELPVVLAENALEAGVYRVQEFLAPMSDGGAPGIQVVSDLQCFKREIHRYMYQLESANRNAPKKPVDKDNHWMDVMRYVIMSLPPFATVSAKGGRVNAALEKWRKARKHKGERSISLGV